MGQCFDRDVVSTRVETEKETSCGGSGSGSSSRRSSSTSSKSFSSSSSCSTPPSSPPTSFSSPFGLLHSSCISSATKQSLAFAKKQRAKVYIVRRCVTMLVLWHKYGEVWVSDGTCCCKQAAYPAHSYARTSTATFGLQQTISFLMICFKLSIQKRQTTTELHSFRPKCVEHWQPSVQ